MSGGAVVRRAVLCSAICGLGLALPRNAAADPPGQSPPSTAPSGQSQQSQGPLVLQPIDNGFVIAPDFKITQLAHTTGEMLGGYAGAEFDRRFLVGGAGYWVIDPYNSVHMGYGGVLLGWRLLGNGTGPVRLDVRDLIGGGSATLYSSTLGPPYVPIGSPYNQPNTQHGYPGYPGYPYYPGYPGYGYYPYAAWTGFFVTEPEARVQLVLGRSVALDGGVSYRVVAAASGLESQLRGVAGSIAVRFWIGQ